jgi:hypothetical protein
LQITAYTFASGGNRYIILSAIFIAAIWTVVVVRVGLLAIVTAQTIFAVAFTLPISIDFSAWYLPSAIAPVIFIAILTAVAFRIAIGNQPMWSGKLLDD